MFRDRFTRFGRSLFLARENRGDGKDLFNGSLGIFVVTGKRVNIKMEYGDKGKKAG